MDLKFKKARKNGANLTDSSKRTKINAYKNNTSLMQKDNQR